MENNYLFIFVLNSLSFSKERKELAIHYIKTMTPITNSTAVKKLDVVNYTEESINRKNIIVNRYLYFLLIIGNSIHPCISYICP